MKNANSTVECSLKPSPRCLGATLTNRATHAHADVQILLTQNATKHSFPCCAVKSRPLVNDCDSLAGFSDFYPPL